MAETPNNEKDRGLVTERKTSPSPLQRSNHLLVIGINAYQDQAMPRLNNARKDAEDLVQVLKTQYDFPAQHIHTLYDEEATLEAILEKLDELADTLYIAPNEPVPHNLLVYLAGHGHYNPKTRLGYFVPHDGFAEKASRTCLQHGNFKDHLNAIACHHLNLLLDTCFSGALCMTRDENQSSGNEQLASRKVLTSGSLEKVADGRYQDNSPFAKAVLAYLKTPKEEQFSFEELAVHVKRAVPANARQQPYFGILQDTGDLAGEFYFRRKQNEVSNPIPQTSEQTDPINEALGMIFVPGGKFTMGYDEEEEDNVPEHEVELGAFFMAKYPTTFEQYDEFCSATKREKPADEGWGRGRRPVIFVNWYDALDYCNWLSEKFGLEPAYTISDNEVHCNWQANGFRLPTEAEWEYAARGGQKSLGYLCAGSNKIAEVGWCSGNSDYETHVVGQKKPNELGLYDLNGNTWEWCWDAFDDDYYEKSPLKAPKGPDSGITCVMRGGSWGTLPVGCRVYIRTEADLLRSQDDSGFRVVRNLDGAEASPKSSRQILVMEKTVWDLPEIAPSPPPRMIEPAVPKPTPKPPSKVEQAIESAGLVLVEGGKFKLGGEIEVELSPFYLGKYQVTFEEYDQFCAATKKEKPGGNGWGRGKRPVMNVNWHDTVAYCNWLSQKYELEAAYNMVGETVQCNWKAPGFRLPTEAEWEYAACGGQKSQGYEYAGGNDLDKVGWYRDNAGSKTHPVGEKQANELGLYDMSGNVWEWCWDWFGDYEKKFQKDPKGPDAGANRVLRGGSWIGLAAGCRVAYRDGSWPPNRNSLSGFRVARLSQ